MAKLIWDVKPMLLLFWFLYAVGLALILRLVLKSQENEAAISYVSYFQFSSVLNSYHSSGTTYGANFGVSLLEHKDWISLPNRFMTTSVIFNLIK